MMKCKHDWVVLISKLEETVGSTTRKGVWEECEMCCKRRLSRLPTAELERRVAFEPGSIFD